MFISPKKAIEEGWITGIADPEKQVQPNAIDFTLDRVFQIDDFAPFIISEAGKQMRGGAELTPVDQRTLSPEESLSFWHLSRRRSYDGLSNVYVDLPEGVAAQLIIRSTFNRNGMFITSGLYDSGYKGHIGFAIHNNSGEAKIGYGTRIGQIIFVSSDSVGTYAGGWNHDAGTHHSEKDVKDGE